jgi:nucleotide-binding universal stress UspA family protein
MEVKKVLYATDFSEFPDDLCEALLDIRKLGLQELILLSVDLPKELQGRFSEYGVLHRVVGQSGPHTSEIFETARRENASLIVAHLKREKRKVLRRSRAEYLIRNTLVPLLLIQENGNIRGSRARPLFESVILATDWSDPAQKALFYVIGLKKILAVLDIVYVFNERPTVRDIRHLKERVEEIRKICLEEEIDAESHFYAGKTGEEIVLASREYNASLIAMGYQQKGILKEIFTGSACYRVAEQSPVPLLIIP